MRIAIWVALVVFAFESQAQTVPFAFIKKPPYPTLVQELETAWGIPSGTTISTSSFNVQAGDVLVAFYMKESDNCSDATISGGSLTWTEKINGYTGSGSWSTLDVWTATVNTNKTMSITFTDTNASGCTQHGVGGVYNFRNSSGIGASTFTKTSGTPSLSLTTVAGGSTVVVFNADWNAVDGSSRAWRLSTIEKTYYFSSGAVTVYGGYIPAIGSASTYTLGLTQPTSQKYTIGAVEVKP